MLRPTIARAFAPRDAQKTADADPAPPRDRLQAVGRLFAELYEDLADRVASSLAEMPYASGPGDADRDSTRSGGEPTEAIEDTDAGPQVIPLRLSKKRSLLDGVEFVLETPQYSLRFLNTLSGTISVCSVEEGRLVPREILSVQATAEGYQPIRKLVRGRRSGFQYTSVRALGDAYLFAITELG